MARRDISGNSWWGCAARVSKILTLFQTKKLSFSAPVFRPGVGRNYIIINSIRTPTKGFLKIHLEFAYYSFFLIHLELKRQIRSCVAAKTTAEFRPKKEKSIPVFRPKRHKTIPFGAAHTYKANIREYFPGGGGGSGKGTRHADCRPSIGSHNMNNFFTL